MDLHNLIKYYHPRELVEGIEQRSFHDLDVHVLYNILMDGSEIGPAPILTWLSELDEERAERVTELLNFHRRIDFPCAPIFWEPERKRLWQVATELYVKGLTRDDLEKIKHKITDFKAIQGLWRLNTLAKHETTRLSSHNCDFYHKMPLSEVQDLVEILEEVALIWTVEYETELRSESDDWSDDEWLLVKCGLVRGAET
jgi:hypothetical protein